MRRLFSMLAIVGFIAVCNCSRIPENNDPVLGYWVKAEFLNEDASRNNTPAITEEWIFNDVYLGRYHRYDDNQIVFRTDFRWEVDKEVYTIVYSSEEMQPVQVSLEKDADDDALQLNNGAILATRK